MKYTIKEQTDGTHLLYRYDILCSRNNGRPTNAELEFWLELMEEKQKLEFIRCKATTYNIAYPSRAADALEEIGKCLNTN